MVLNDQRITTPTLLANLVQERSASCGLERKTESHCGYCNFFGELIWVHGHGQCSNCGKNIEECCQGQNLIL